MTLQNTHEPETVFDLAEVDREMRGDETYERGGHIAQTLVRLPDLRVVLIALKGGHEIAEHDAENSIAIHAISGRVRVQFGDRTVELGPGQLLALERGVLHSVEAPVDSAILLTLGCSDRG